MTVNERVKDIRKSLGLTMEKFGNRIGLKKAAVSVIESGKCSVTDANIKSICREFNVNEEWLRNGTGDMFIEMDPENQLMIWAANVLKDNSDSFKHRAVKMLMSLTEEEWDLLERKAKELFDSENT